MHEIEMHLSEETGNMAMHACGRSIDHIVRQTLGKAKHAGRSVQEKDTGVAMAVREI